MLHIWELGLNKSPIEKSLLLLAYAYPEYNLQEIAAFSIGDRDARLLNIREKLFGQVLQNSAVCPQCGQKIEWETALDSLRLQEIRETGGNKRIDLTFGEHQISFRLPNSADILHLMTDDGSDIQANALMGRCIINTPSQFKHVENFPEDLKDTIVQKMEESDPQADVVMNISCPECRHSWNMVFDIMHYLWLEINECVIKLIQDIYLLAGNFGWAENDILDMSRFRRNMYINMINS